jgi:hypothetical protein
LPGSCGAGWPSFKRHGCVIDLHIPLSEWADVDLSNAFHSTDGQWRMTNIFAVQDEVQELMTPEMSFHTPPSSPPPFDAISGEKSPPHKPVSPAGPTLRERLRNLGQTISVIRRFGSAGFVSSRPVTSSIRCLKHELLPALCCHYRTCIITSTRTRRTPPENKGNGWLS